MSAERSKRQTGKTVNALQCTAENAMWDFVEGSVLKSNTQN
jgi:hypothetical protein